MKKPVYKKWWFWVIVLLVIAGAGAGSARKKEKTVTIDNSGATEQTKTEADTAESAATENTEQEKVKVGGSFTLNNMKVTINNADMDFQVKNDDFGFYKPKEGYKLVAVDVTEENIGDSDVYVGTTDFKCFADNVECEDEFISSESDFINTNLSPGRTVSFKVFFRVPQNASSVEMEYERSISFDDQKVIIELQ